MKRFLLMIPMGLPLLTACGSKQAPSAEIPGDGAWRSPCRSSPKRYRYIPLPWAA